MSDREHDGFELIEDFILISSAVDRGIYKASRYEKTSYDHLHDDALEELEAVRAMVDETLERYVVTESSSK